MTVGGAIEDEAARRFVDAWHRAERGVHADVQALTEAGLLDATNGGLRADYDAIETKIAI